VTKQFLSCRKFFFSCNENIFLTEGIFFLQTRKNLGEEKKSWGKKKIFGQETNLGERKKNCFVILSREIFLASEKKM